jgi:phosphatidylglycerol---prolipoprotein diacylglyceryl transferase
MFYVTCCVLHVMFTFLHSFNPQPILINLGPVKVYWYGVFIVVGILAAIAISIKLAEKYRLDKNIIIDSSFLLIIGGIIGARLLHVLLELPFYIKNPLNIFMLWQGGLAIHGAIIAGIIILYYFTRKNKLNFWLLASIYAPGLALAQSIGRWGNYFNQELFGRPTNLPWGIPIIPINRVLEFYNFQYFHPTFLYESIGNFIIFLILIAIHYFILKNINNDKTTEYKKIETKYTSCVLLYLIMYSLLRIFIESLRVDVTPIIFGWRLPQITSLILIVLPLIILLGKKRGIRALEKK